jgi:uncharacterized membrane protein YqgA involved in biofilm formation
MSRLKSYLTGTTVMLCAWALVRLAVSFVRYGLPTKSAVMLLCVIAAGCLIGEALHRDTQNNT